MMTALRLVTDDFPQTVSLTEGIAKLERGNLCPGLCVDLGFGAFARADGERGQAGLTQRLMGHRLLMALARDPAQVGIDLPDRPLDIGTLTKELLDLARAER